MPTRRSLLAASLALPALGRGARAAAWPDRPSRWMVAYGAGGASDLFARMISRALAAGGAPPLVVENRPSGGGIVATEAVLATPPDGANVLHVDNGMMVYNPALYTRLPFDPDRDLVMAAFVARFPFFVLVRADSPLRDFEALRAAGQRDALTYATPAVASPHHMCRELLRRRAGFQAQHVPYRGMPAVMQDMVAGRVDCAVADVTNALPFVTDGRARAGNLRRHPRQGAAGCSHLRGGRGDRLRRLWLAGGGPASWSRARAARARQRRGAGRDGRTRDGAPSGDHGSGSAAAFGRRMRRAGTCRIGRLAAVDPDDGDQLDG